MECATSKASDQPVYKRSLIRAFASMGVKLLTEHHLELLSLKGGCTGLSESTHVKTPHCWKSHHGSITSCVIKGLHCNSDKPVLMKSSKLYIMCGSRGGGGGGGGTGGPDPPPLKKSQKYGVS